MTLPIATQRILQGTAATLSATFTDQDGIPATPSGAVTVGVTRWDGTTVLAAGTATTVYGPGVYQRALTSAQTAALDYLTATWTAAGGQVVTTTVAVVGGYYFSVADARRIPSLEDSGKVTDRRIIDVRRQVEEEAERIIGVAFVPTFRAVTIWGGGQDYLNVPNLHLRKLRAINFGNVALSGDALTNTVISADGRVERYWPFLSNATDDSWGMWGQRFPNRTRVTVAYEHGLDRPPEDLKGAMLRRLRSLINAEVTGVPDRAVTFQAVEGGTFSLATPGTGRWQTGIPDVDAVYFDCKRRYGIDRSTLGSAPIDTGYPTTPAPMV